MNFRRRKNKFTVADDRDLRGKNNKFTVADNREFSNTITLYCLRFLGIYTKEECAEKLRWLLGRLLLLLAEDGRKPTTIKVVKLTCVRFFVNTTVVVVYFNAIKTTIYFKEKKQITFKPIEKLSFNSYSLFTCKLVI